MSILFLLAVIAVSLVCARACRHGIVLRVTLDNSPDPRPRDPPNTLGRRGTILPWPTRPGHS